MAKKHDINMIADWARDWGIRGYDHLDPKQRAQKAMDEKRKAAARKARAEKYENNKSV